MGNDYDKCQSISVLKLDNNMLVIQQLQQLITIYQMFQLPTNSTHLPISSTKLNFYLAQCKSQPNKPSHSRHPNSNHIKIKRASNPRLSNQVAKPYQINLQSTVNRRVSKQNRQKLQQQRLQNVLGNQSFVSVNACQNQIRLSPSKQSQLNYNQNDALDHLITDRSNQQIQINRIILQRQTDRGLINNQKSVRFQEDPINNYSSRKINYWPPSHEQQNYSIRNQDKQDWFRNNNSDIVYSRQRNNNYNNSQSNNLNNRQNISYFHHQNNQNQNKFIKKVNWRTQPKKMEKKSVYYLKMDSQFKQISNQLSRLTYELNSNSKKLQEMNKAYVAIKMATKSSPQQSLKRANLKYATVDVAQANQGYGLNHKPHIEYYDKAYRDPRYLIWQPLHSNNTLIKQF